jgi:hypothetical protein
LLKLKFLSIYYGQSGISKLKNKPSLLNIRYSTTGNIVNSLIVNILGQAKNAGKKAVEEILALTETGRLPGEAVNTKGEHQRDRIKLSSLHGSGNVSTTIIR